MYSIDLTYADLFFLAACAALLFGLRGMMLKAGQPGWAGLLPVYGQYCWLRIAGYERPFIRAWLLSLGHPLILALAWFFYSEGGLSVTTSIGEDTPLWQQILTWSLLGLSLTLLVLIQIPGHLIHGLRIAHRFTDPAAVATVILLAALPLAWLPLIGDGLELVPSIGSALSSFANDWLGYGGPLLAWAAAITANIAGYDPVAFGGGRLITADEL